MPRGCGIFYFNDIKGVSADVFPNNALGPDANYDSAYIKNKQSKEICPISRQNDDAITNVPRMGRGRVYVAAVFFCRVTRTLSH